MCVNLGSRNSADNITRSGRYKEGIAASVGTCPMISETKFVFVRFCMKFSVKKMMPTQLFPVSCIFCLISTSILMVKVKGVVSMNARSSYNNSLLLGRLVVFAFRSQYYIYVCMYIFFVSLNSKKISTNLCFLYSLLSISHSSHHS